MARMGMPNVTGTRQRDTAMRTMTRIRQPSLVRVVADITRDDGGERVATVECRHVHVMVVRAVVQRQQAWDRVLAVRLRAYWRECRRQQHLVRKSLYRLCRLLLLQCSCRTDTVRILRGSSTPHIHIHLTRCQRLCLLLRQCNLLLLLFLLKLQLHNSNCYSWCNSNNNLCNNNRLKCRRCSSKCSKCSCNSNNLRSLLTLLSAVYDCLLRFSYLVLLLKHQLLVLKFLFNHNNPLFNNHLQIRMRMRRHRLLKCRQYLRCKIREVEEEGVEDQVLPVEGVAQEGNQQVDSSLLRCRYILFQSQVQQLHTAQIRCDC